MYSDNFLIIKLSGTPWINERLLIRKFLLDRLPSTPQRVIIDMKNVSEGHEIFILGILNLIKKEIQIRGGELKLCSLSSKFYRQFKENRWDKIFDIFPSIDEAQKWLNGQKDEKQNRRT